MMALDSIVRVAQKYQLIAPALGVPQKNTHTHTRNVNLVITCTEETWLQLGEV